MFEIEKNHQLLAYKIIKIVKRVLDEIGVDVPFYVAGGSVFSIFTSSQAKDVDVFFYDEESLKTVIDAVCTTNSGLQFHSTNNAITTVSTITAIQFIKVSFGSPEEVFEKFDLNCSRIGISSDFQFLSSDDLSKNLDVTLDNLTSSTWSRVDRYAKTKGAYVSNECVKKILGHLCENALVEIPVSYENEDKKKGCDILEEIIISENRKSGWSTRSTESNIEVGDLHQTIHNFLNEAYSGSDLVEAFEGIPSLEVGSPYSQEFLASRALNPLLRTIFQDREIENTKRVYPEYFI